MLLTLVLVLLAVVAQRIRLPSEQHAPIATENWTLSTQPTGETVSLEIDFGNGASKRFAALPWREQMRVDQLMLAASDYRPGITFLQVGTGEAGLLTAIDGLANEGIEGRNWLYSVDDQQAEVSFCEMPLEPGAHVLWTFSGKVVD